MNRGWILAMALSLWGCGDLSHDTAADTPDPPDLSVHTGEMSPWKVLRVVDGDTLELASLAPAGKPRIERVRLLRIDTPEKDQWGYLGATSALQELVVGKSVQLVHEEPGQERRGDHGRLLAYVFVGELNVNVEMVRKGWSRFWTAYGRGRFARDFEEAQEEAVSLRVGLWAAE